MAASTTAAAYGWPRAHLGEGRGPQSGLPERIASDMARMGCWRLVRKDGISVPYSVIYDVAASKITALRLYFTGPAQP
jgi:hypothetical protein